MRLKSDWLTHAEKSSFQETSRYDAVIEYCRRLAKASHWVRFTSFGKSPQGRDLPLLIVSKEKIFTPEQSKNGKSAILLIINGIHPGEIAGKEASLMLIRDIAITKKKNALLDNVTILMVPIYSVDGHERFGPYNRANQNGPREMGWRATSQNLNLNRDWIKVDQPETRAMLNLYLSWLPDFVIDNHVSDGADFQYDVTYILDQSPPMAPSLRKYIQEEFEPYLASALKKSGHISTIYFELRDPSDPSAGMNVGPTAGRYSNGYGTLQNRPTIVVETHMLKTFERRIQAHYDLMEAVLTKFNEYPEGLREVVRKSDEESIALGEKSNAPAAYPIATRVNSDRSEPFVFQGVEYKREISSVSGATKIVYGTQPVEITIRHYHELEPAITITPPLGYIIPVQWTSIIERLEVHRIAFSRLSQPLSGEFETYRFEDVTWDASPFEGHHMVHYKTHKVMERRELPAGSAVVRLNQRCNKVILELLEPDAVDSLVAWGFFDSIFEQKEYMENYLLEKMAEEMLQEDPNLQVKFEKRLQEDPEFKASAMARLHFFYEKSPYRDDAKNAYPVIRITSPNQIP